MTAIAIRFLAGRYHATGWDHHVNEGVPEWPPAPWRLLRSLVAAYYRMADRPARDGLASLLDKLQSPPSYCLPPVQAAHTRHYMPTHDKTKLVVDSFVAVGSGAGAGAGEIVIAWPGLQLSTDDQKLLRNLLDHVGYLGRAESWVECRLLESDPGDFDARPLTEGESHAHEARVLGALPTSDYKAWRAGLLQSRGSATAVAPPESLLELLEFDTMRLHAERWSAMPGIRWLRYGFAADPFRSRPRQRALVPAQGAPTLARYAVHSAVLPNISDAVGIGERMRQALLAHSRDDRGVSHEVFLGRDSNGEPMRGHRHAFFLPEDSDGDGRIDHVLVWARGGFDARSVAALRSVTRLWGSDGHDLWLALVGMGHPADYGTSLRAQLPGGSAACGKSKVWRSVTPFVPTRHAKIRKGDWCDLPIQQVESLLRQDGLHPDEIVSLHASGPRWSRFRRLRRAGHGARGMDAAFGFEVRFAEAVQGPIAIGYGAHFGLGRFEAVD